MKVVTWNVNGIRARQHELGACWRPNSPTSCACRRSRRRADKVPELLVSAGGLLVLLARRGRLFRRGAARSSQFFHGTAGLLSHPSFDMENAHRRGRPWGPGGGLGLRAERRQGLRRKLRFFEALDGWAAETKRARPVATPLWRPECCARGTGCASEGAQAESDRHATRGARWLARCSRTNLVDVGRALDPDNDELFTWWAPWRNLRQRNIGWRIDYVLASRDLAGATAARSESRRKFGTSDHAPLRASRST